MAGTLSLQKPWLGKVLGIAAALVLGPADPLSLLWWLGAGLVLGQILDSLSERFSSRPAKADARVAPSLEFAFTAMGWLAKIGGSVLPAHILCAEERMSRYGLDGSRRKQAIAWFKRGKEAAGAAPSIAASRVLVVLAARCRRECSAKPVVLDAVLECLYRIALVADSKQRRDAVRVMGDMLGVSEDAVNAGLERLAARLELERAYEILGVSAEDEAQAVKAAYRRQVARCHPDRLPQTVDRHELKAAEQRMSDLREALENIENARAA
jgi:DnaJ like chaperone protein